MRGEPEAGGQKPEASTGDSDASESPSWVPVMLHDVQFWVPVAVLGIGILVLQWVR